MKESIPLKATYKEFRCKFCGSNDIIRYGTFRGIQRWWCNDCERKFADNDALPNMKTPVEQVASALNMYYEGMSLNAIRRHLLQMHNNYPSDSTVYEWVDEFTNKAMKQARNYQPKVGDTWIADETVLKIGGRNVWFWDLIDTKTRFLLASHMSFKRTTQHARTLVEKASKRADKIPKVIITDKLYAYLDGIELAFGADTEHVQSKGFRVQPNTNIIERFHGTLKARTKVMRGLKKPETALLLLDGWLVHYNFFRPHEALGDKTPAEASGIRDSFRNWVDIVAKRKIITTEQTDAINTTIIPELSRKPSITRKGFRISPRMPRISPPTPRISAIR